MTSWPSMTLNDLLNNLVCVEYQMDHSYQISAQLEHFVLNRKWPHNDPLMTVNDVLSILTCLDRLEDHSHQNFSSIGAFFIKPEVTSKWPLNDLEWPLKYFKHDYDALRIIHVKFHLHRTLLKIWPLTHQLWPLGSN